MIAGRVKAFDRRDLATRDIGHGRNAGANGFLLDNNRAGATERLTATKFGAGQADLVPDKPKQGEGRIAFPGLLLAIYFQFYHDRFSLLDCRSRSVDKLPPKILSHSPRALPVRTGLGCS